MWYRTITAAFLLSVSLVQEVSANPIAGEAVRRFILGVASGAGTAAGQAGFNAIINSPAYSAPSQQYPRDESQPRYYPPAQNTQSHQSYPSYQQAYTPPRTCRVEYQRELISREYIGDEIVDQWFDGRGTVARWRSVYRNHWRNHPVQICD